MAARAHGFPRSESKAVDITQRLATGSCAGVAGQVSPTHGLCGKALSPLPSLRVIDVCHVKTMFCFLLLLSVAPASHKAGIETPNPEILNILDT